MVTQDKPNRTTVAQPQPPDSVHSVTPANINYNYPNTPVNADRRPRKSN